MAIDIRQYEDALSSPDPVMQLRQLVIDHMEQKGLTNEQMLEVLEHVRLEVRTEMPFAEDVVLDVMDFLAGWCSPHVKIG
jgi:hypothetical protein